MLCVRTLNLEGNSLGRDGMMHFSQGLSFNHSLTSLNLSSNQFGGHDKIPNAEDAIKYLTIGLAGCTTLKQLNIDGNLIGNSGLEILYASCLSGQLNHLHDISFTPFVETDLYKSIVDKIESNKPVKKKKKKTKKKSAKKK